MLLKENSNRLLKENSRRDEVLNVSSEPTYFIGSSRKTGVRYQDDELDEALPLEDHLDYSLSLQNLNQSKGVEGMWSEGGQGQDFYE